MKWPLNFGPFVHSLHLHINLPVHCSTINFSQELLVILCSLILKWHSLFEKKAKKFRAYFCRDIFSLKLIETLSLIYISHAWQIFVVSNQFSALLAPCLFAFKSEFYVGFIVFKRHLLPDLTPCVMTGNKTTKCLLKPVGVYIEYSSLSFLKAKLPFCIDEGY